MKVAIIGAGTYGAYAASVISDKFPAAEIHMFEVGGQSCQSEEEIGYLSEGEGVPYYALSKGRFFGLGGTSARWGGQVLTFSDCEFDNPSPFLKDLVALNQNQKGNVASRLGIPLAEPEAEVAKGLHLKEGVWLGYRRRNLYRTLGLDRKPGIRLHLGSRVVRLEQKSGRIVSLVMKRQATTERLAFDFYVLATGAFESNRLLMVSNLAPTKTAFSDHLSRRAFKLDGPTTLGSTDFGFRFERGSMITRRLVGEVQGLSFFVHPIFNADFPFFQDLKALLYRGETSAVGRIASNVSSGARFAFDALVRKRLYVDGPWYFQVDVEAPPDAGTVELSNELDRYGERSLRYCFSHGQQVATCNARVNTMIRAFLDDHGVGYSEIGSDEMRGKYEDTYHPYGMFGSMSNSIESFYNRFHNMLVVNTGILPRAGSINCTAAVFPVIEDFVANRLSERLKSFTVKG